MIHPGCSYGVTTMGLLKTFRKVPKVELYECRNCGEKSGESVDNCPNCNCREIAYYEI